MRRRWYDFWGRSRTALRSLEDAAELLLRVYNAQRVLGLNATLVAKCAPHETLHTSFSREVLLAVTAKAGTDHACRLMDLGATRCKLHWANCENESYEHLLAELMYWLGHHRVQVAVGFKIYLRSEGGHMLAPHMFITAMEKTTSGLVLHAPLHFGAGSDCIAARLAKYQLRLDVGMLFEDTSDAGKPGTAGFMQVDLYHIRDDVYTSINQDPESMGEVPNAVLEEHARNLQDFAARNNLTYEPDARNANTMRSTRTTHRFRRVQFGV
ncbi:hypothetical protein WJX72_003850 [[Myrmecia] bisecta]|uniref:Uncharacterized protein n=1 Tax=[Myrmecia] bisecta TaxID=41462 RepID=A0AAW1QES1_9CHLO